ncbi:MAG TPA: class I SAM-dependent methyltransferase [Actinomycetota bacterium]|nr:class I SAM-dependent methyltransferase [Actinomycetota bacterium]
MLRDPVPPRRLWPAPSEFRASAERNVRFLIEHAGLRPDARILDVGCGPGRLALALRDYFGEAGRYEGFDVQADAVDWATREIGRGDPRFRFTHVDVRNRAYHARGRVHARAFRFPYPDRRFDLVVMFSVLTHLLPDGLHRYLAESHRVLVPGGRCVATFYLMDRPSVVSTGNATFQISHRSGPFFTSNPSVPEEAVGYPEPYVRDAARRAGLIVEEPIHAGRWRSPGPAAGWQDAVVARRPDEVGGR